MIANRTWLLDPHSGGVPISPSRQSVVERRLRKYAEANYSGCFQNLDIRFRRQFCYLGFYRPIPPRSYKPFRMTYDEYLEHIRSHPVKMARLRHFDLERWSCAFFTYSNETYKPCLLRSGQWFGTVEECFDVGAVHFE